MQAALHENAGATEVERLLNFREDNFLRMQVTFFVSDGAIESAEAAIFSTEIRVIDISVDDVSNYAFRMEPAADGVGGHADADQIIGAEEVGCFGAGHHAGISRVSSSAT